MWRYLFLVIVQSAIDPEVKPLSQHLRRIPVSQIDAVNNELDRMLEQDVIEEVNEPSPWVSNLVIVPKKSGDLRVCCDLREVNKAVTRERHVLPKVDDTLHALRGSKYFAKIDAKNRGILPHSSRLEVVTVSSALPSDFLMRAKPFKK